MPHLMVTDPPYGVNYDPSWRERFAATPNNLATGTVLNDDRADWREAWALFPGDVAYVWHGCLHAALVAGSLEAAGFAVRSQIIWDKTRLVIGRGDYHFQHEPCQPAGTMVQMVIERGAGSQPAKIQEVPIETLRTGDLVVSWASRSVGTSSSRPFPSRLLRTLPAALPLSLELTGKTLAIRKA